jgi:hypothetical protein
VALKKPYILSHNASNESNNYGVTCIKTDKKAKQKSTKLNI